MVFDPTKLVNPEEMAQQAADGAQRGIVDWFLKDGLWLVLIFGFIFPPVLSIFKDKLPPDWQHNLSWVTGFGDMIMGWLSQVPFIGEFFSGFVNKSAAAMTEEQIQKSLTDQGLSAEAAKAFAPSQETWKEFVEFVGHKTRKGTIASPFNHAVVRDLLLTSDGQVIARRLLEAAKIDANARATAAKAAPTKDAEGKDIPPVVPAVPAVVTQFTSTLRGVINSEDFSKIMGDAGARKILFDGAAALTGIRFTSGDAYTNINTFMNASSLDATAQKALINGFLGTPAEAEKTLTDLANRQGVFAAADKEAVRTLVQNIDTNSLPTGAKESLAKLQAFMNSPAYDTISALPAEIATPLTSNDPATQQGAIAALLVDSQVEDSKVAAFASQMPPMVKPLFTNPASLTALRTMLGAMSDEDTKKFVAAAQETDPAKAQAALTPILLTNQAAAKTFTAVLEAQIVADPLLKAWADGDGKEVLAGLRTLSATTPEQAKAAAAFANAGGTDKGIALAVEMSSIVNVNEFLTVMFKDDKRGQIMDPAVLPVVASQIMSMNIPLVQSVLPGKDTDKNLAGIQLDEAGAKANAAALDATFALLAAIDENSGGNPDAPELKSEYERNAARKDEETADDRNTRVMNFLMNMMQPRANVIWTNTDKGGFFDARSNYEFMIQAGIPENLTPDALCIDIGNTRVKAQEIADFFKENEKAFDTFFETKDEKGAYVFNSPLFEVMRRRFTTDETSKEYGEWGLVNILNEGDAIGQVLRIMHEKQRVQLTADNLASHGGMTDSKISDNSEGIRLLGLALKPDATIASIANMDLFIQYVRASSEMQDADVLSNAYTKDQTVSYLESLGLLSPEKTPSNRDILNALGDIGGNDYYTYGTENKIKWDSRQP